MELSGSVLESLRTRQTRAKRRTGLNEMADNSNPDTESEKAAAEGGRLPANDHQGSARLSAVCVCESKLTF